MKSPIPENLQHVDRAFSAQAPLFDDIQRRDPTLEWMRSVVHRQAERYFRPGETIIDINAGTGIDALHFADRGLSVHAMDIAEGMVAQIRSKVTGSGRENIITVERRSFEELDGLAPRRFHHLFSNFGGLNCIPDLTTVARNAPKILHPGGTVTVVIMPPVCPWEIAALVNGKPRIALRRLQRNGVRAHIEGEYFTTYYHTVGAVRRAFGPEFVTEELRSAAFFTPPPSLARFPKRFPRVIRFLQRCDERFSQLPPFNRCGDQFILTLRYRPANIRW